MSTNLAPVRPYLQKHNHLLFPAITREQPLARAPKIPCVLRGSGVKFRPYSNGLSSYEISQNKSQIKRKNPWGLIIKSSTLRNSADLFTSLTIFVSFSFPISVDDHSRVILQPIEDDPSSDYINANYIDVSGNASNATIGSQRNQRNHTPSLVCQASIPLLRLLVIHRPIFTHPATHENTSYIQARVFLPYVSIYSLIQCEFKMRYLFFFFANPANLNDVLVYI